MRITLLSYLFTHAAEYYVWLRNKEYEGANLVDLGNIFDSRSIVLHVVIVLGVFISNWVNDGLFPDHPKAGSIAFAAFFVLVKTFADILSYKWQTSRQDAITTLFGKSNKSNA